MWFIAMAGVGGTLAFRAKVFSYCPVCLLSLKCALSVGWQWRQVSDGRGQHGSSPLSFRGKAWKEQTLLMEEGADRSFQGNICQQLLLTALWGPSFCTMTARQASGLCRKLLPAAGDGGISALLQPRAAFKPLA